MVADGHVCKAEPDVLDRLDVHEQLGLQPEELNIIVHAFCEDLLPDVQLAWADACRVDPGTLAELMAEVDDPELCLKVLRLCISVSEADGHVAEGGEIVDACVHPWPTCPASKPSFCSFLPGPSGSA